MANYKTIKHSGLIYSINGSKIKVQINQESACASCHAKGACTVSDVKEKLVDVYTSGQDNLRVGEHVVIEGRQSLGLQAAIFAYIVPLFLVVITLFIVSSLTSDEVVAGVSSLLILIPYYILLKFLTPIFKKKFLFTLKN